MASPLLRTLSADLLQMIPGNHVLLVKLCAFYPGSPAEIQQLHQRVSVCTRVLTELLLVLTPAGCGCSAGFRPLRIVGVWQKKL